MTDKRSKEERVALINARQAIIIAVIAAMSGIMGAIIQKFSISPSVKQPWIVIRKVSFFYGDSIGNQETISGQNARVIIHLDGVAYSYPGRDVLGQVGPDMAEEMFPLPIGLNEYSLSFEIYVDDRFGDFLKYNSNEIVKVKQTPFKYEYKLYPVNKGVRSANPNASVEFEIRSDIYN